MLSRSIFLTLILCASILSFSQVKVSKTFHSNGKIHSISRQDGGHLHQTIYYPNGRIKQEVNLTDGRLNGKQVEFDSVGSKTRELLVFGIDQVAHNLFYDTTGFDDRYVDVITGKEVCFFPNGNMKSEGYLINACKAGLWIYYSPDGSHKQTVFYKKLTR